MHKLQVIVSHPLIHHACLPACLLVYRLVSRFNSLLHARLHGQLRPSPRPSPDLTTITIAAAAAAGRLLALGVEHISLDSLNMFMLGLVKVQGGCSPLLPYYDNLYVDAAKAQVSLEPYLPPSPIHTHSPPPSIGGLLTGHRTSQFAFESMFATPSRARGHSACVGSTSLQPCSRTHEIRDGMQTSESIS